jgi:chromosome segregation ATPase
MRLEEELAKLRQEHDELSQKLVAEQTAAADASLRAKEVESCLSHNAADSDRARAELERQKTERQQAELEWREEIEAAKALSSRLDCALAEATEQIKRLGHDAEVLQHDRDELQRRLLAEGQTSQGHIRKLEADWSAATDRSRTLETQLTDLQRELDELVAKLAADQNALADAERAHATLENLTSERELAEAEICEQLRAANAHNSELKRSLSDGAARIEQLERRVEQDAGELELVRAEAEQLRSERERTDSDWSEQLEAAKTSARKLEADLTASVEHSVGLENELSSVCHHRDELAVQFQSEQQSSAQAAEQVAEVEQRLVGLTAELELIRAEAEQLRSERERADSDWSEQLEAAKTLATSLNDAWTEATELNQRFEGEVASLREEREELHTKLATTQLEAADSESRAMDLKSHLETMAKEVQRLSQENAKYKGTLSIDPKLLQAEQYTFVNLSEQPGRRKSPVSTKRRRSKRSE